MDTRTTMTMMRPNARKIARSSRACEVCHDRKVRCDVTSKMPCTNCVALNFECKVPKLTKKRGRKISEAWNKKPRTSSEKNHDANNDPLSPLILQDPLAIQSMEGPEYITTSLNFTKGSRRTGVEATDYIETDIPENGSPNSTLSAATFQDLRESDSFNLLIQNGPKHIELDPEDMEILKIKGAFLLPAKELCDELVQSFFDKVHPWIPIINETQFKKKYQDPKDPPSIILLQAILLAASRVSRNPRLLDLSGSTRLATNTFYKRAKALFYCNYETDSIAVIQSLALMGWSTDDPQDITNNVFYWPRVSINIALGLGLDLRIKNEKLPVLERRLYKRIWWGLFVRDRYTALAFDRPVMINVQECDVPYLEECDFIEDDTAISNSSAPSVKHMYYFHVVRLIEIMGEIGKYTGKNNITRNNGRAVDTAKFDRALAEWVNGLPSEMRYIAQDHDFFKALLHFQYYSALLILHRFDDQHTMSKNCIAYKSALLISKIVTKMMALHELVRVPPYFPYFIFWSIVILIRYTNSTVSAVADMANDALSVSISALKEITLTWDLARKALQIITRLTSESSPKANPSNSYNNKLFGDRVFEAAKTFYETEIPSDPTLSPSKNDLELAADHPSKLSKASYNDINWNETFHYFDASQLFPNFEESMKHDSASPSSVHSDQIRKANNGLIPEQSLIAPQIHRAEELNESLTMLNIDEWYEQFVNNG